MANRGLRIGYPVGYRLLADQGQYALNGQSSILTYGPGGNGMLKDLLAFNRGTDWDLYAGATAPNRTTLATTINAYGTSGSPASSAGIQNAGAAAAHDTYIQLGPGTFHLSDASNLNQGKRITYRGMIGGGGIQTILKYYSDGGTVFPWGGAPVTICGNPVWNADAIPGVSGAPAQTPINVTGSNGVPNSFIRGNDILDFVGGHSFVNGDSGILVQNNEPDGSLPAANVFFGSTKTDHSGSTTNGISWQGAYEDFGANLMQRFLVIASNSTSIQIYPPLIHGQWKMARTPRVYRYAAGIFANSIGLENIIIDTTALGVETAIIGMMRATECWTSGVVLNANPTAGGDYGIALTDCSRVTVRHPWLRNFTGGGIFTTTSYGISLQGTSFWKIENPIFDGVESPITINIGCSGGVCLYPYEGNQTGEGGIDHHQPGACYNLFEGGSMLKYTSDLFHGNSMCETFFRVHGYDRGFDLQSYHRYYNIIGPVIHATEVRKTLGSSGAYNRWAGFGIRGGYNGQNATTNPFDNGGDLIGIAVDDSVMSTAFIWGMHTTTGGTQFNAAEVPISDPLLPQPLPPNNNLPNSGYYTTRPGYFTIAGIGTLPWPLIGPDVTGAFYESGHAGKTPAQVMYEACAGNYLVFDPTRYGT